MTRQFIIIVLLCFVQYACSQRNNLAKTPPGMPTEMEFTRETENHHCVKKTYLSFTERQKNYPFNKAAQIQLVSFEGGVDTSEWKNMRNLHKLPLLNDTVCYSKLKEYKAITVAQIDTLTDILYNYGYGGPVYIGTVNQCYFPRNAILFLDKNGKLLEYIEICFECKRTVFSSKKISLGDKCDEKMGMLKDFFKSAGIEYGITKGLMDQR